MQFAQFTPGADSIRILQIGDIAKVVSKEYGTNYRTHFVLIEDRGAWGVENAWVEFTDLEVGGYSPALRRRTLDTTDEFWAGLVPTTMDEAYEQFMKVRAGVAQRRMAAETAMQEAIQLDSEYSILADRLWGAF